MSGNLSGALFDLFSLLSEENYSIIPTILEGVIDVMERNFYLLDDHLQKLKPYVESYDENIQELAIKIYTDSLIQNPTLFRTEAEFAISKLRHFEPTIREKFVDFLIRIYSEYPDFELHIIKGLILNLNDEFWNIRIKIVNFLNGVLMDRPQIIKAFDKELEILYEENDIDVIGEIHDFLLRLFIETYSLSDVEILIKSITNRDWISQEKIIKLIGKLAISKKDLIKPYTMDILILLDHEDFLVNKAIMETLKEIVKYHADLFDESIFILLNNDEIENMDAIEDLLEDSINHHGFTRFFQLFNFITLLDIQVIITMNSVIKKLYLNDPRVVETLFSDLIKEAIHTLNMPSYTKIRMLLKAIPQYDIYYNVHQTLNNLRVIDNFEAETLKLELLGFLSETLPELDYLHISAWLESELPRGPVSIEDLCSKFSIHPSKVLDILSVILKKKMLDAIISNNIIELVQNKADENDDVLFFKQWKIRRKPNLFEYQITLFLQIKNVTNNLLTDVNIFIIYPKDALEKNKPHQKFPITLEPNESFTTYWIFQRKREDFSEAKSRRLKVVTIYKKMGHLFTRTKDLDILFL